MGINWGDAPTWGAVIVGAAAATAALVQLRQQGNVLKGEVERAKRRDELLDGQLRELAEVARLRERAQAEDVDLVWVRDNGDSSFVRVINESPRPIRCIACRAGSRDDAAVLARPDRAAEQFSLSFPTGHEQWIMPREDAADGVVAVIKSGGRAGFLFRTVKRDENTSRVMARFTDDAGLHWELDDALHLVKLDSRNNW